MASGSGLRRLGLPPEEFDPSTYDAAIDAPANLESPVLIAQGFPTGWYYSVVCSWYDQKIRSDKYWQGPGGHGYRSFKQITDINKDIEFDREVFLEDVAKTVAVVSKVMLGEADESVFDDRAQLPGLPASDGEDAPEVIVKKNTHIKPKPPPKPRPPSKPKAPKEPKPVAEKPYSPFEDGVYEKPTMRARNDSKRSYNDEYVFDEDVFEDNGNVDGDGEYGVNGRSTSNASTSVGKRQRVKVGGSTQKRTAGGIKSMSSRIVKLGVVEVGPLISLIDELQPSVLATVASADGEPTVEVDLEKMNDEMWDATCEYVKRKEREEEGRKRVTKR
jgi:hypothetical protein